jgi:hypothetical protein
MGTRPLRRWRWLSAERLSFTQHQLDPKESPMTTWTTDELAKVAAAEVLEITSLRSDGTQSSARTIWVVPLADDLYVRSVNGPGSAWFRDVTQRHEGHIRAGGVDQDVTLVETHDDDDGIDAAYRAKYNRYADDILDHITGAEARSTTLRLVPRTR